METTEMTDKLKSINTTRSGNQHLSSTYKSDAAPPIHGICSGSVSGPPTRLASLNFQATKNRQKARAQNHPNLITSACLVQKSACHLISLGGIVQAWL